MADATETATPEPVSETDARQVYAIIDALKSADDADVPQHIGLRKIGCTKTPAGVGSPPLCQGREKEGDLIDAFYYATCEGQYLRAPQLGPMLDALKQVEFYRAYRVPRKAGSEWDYAIILVDRGAERNGMGWEAIADKGEMIGLLFSCALTPDELIAARHYTVEVPTPGPAVTTPLP